MYKVLLIDDEPLVVASLERRLEWEQYGFSVAGKAHNAVEGLKQIDALQPDLVFTDIRMPGMNGLDLLKEARGRYPKMLFAVLSGYGEFEYAKRAIEYGVLGFCVKPFDEEEIYSLLEKARAFLETRSASSRLPFALSVGRQDPLEKKRDFFEQENLLNETPKWVLEIHGELQPVRPQGIRVWRIPTENDRIALLVSGDLEASLLLAGDAPAGVSSTFTAPEEFENACMEARIASYSFFFDLGVQSRFSGRLENKATSEMLRRMSTAFFDRNLKEIRVLMDEFRAGFSVGKFTMRDAFRLHNSAAMLMPDLQDRLCDSYSEIAQRHQKASVMVERIESALILVMADMEVNSARPEAVRDVLLYINEHYQDPNLSISRIAEIFNFNASYLSQIFKRSERENLSVYLARLRVERACTLLKDSSCQVRQVGELVGYPDYFYFAKVFKKLTGFTPSDYRANHRKGLYKTSKTEEDLQSNPPDGYVQ